jgi:hypothetical protein
LNQGLRPRWSWAASRRTAFRPVIAVGPFLLAADYLTTSPVKALAADRDRVLVGTPSARI